MRLDESLDESLAPLYMSFWDGGAEIVVVFTPGILGGVEGVFWDSIYYVNIT